MRAELETRLDWRLTIKALSVLLGHSPCVQVPHVLAPGILWSSDPHLHPTVGGQDYQAGCTKVSVQQVKYWNVCVGKNVCPAQKPMTPQLFQMLSILKSDLATKGLYKVTWSLHLPTPVLGKAAFIH